MLASFICANRRESIAHLIHPDDLRQVADTDIKKIISNAILREVYPGKFVYYARKVVRSFWGNQGIWAGGTGCRFALDADVFHQALEKGLDIVIEDVSAPNIAGKIPAWHGKAVNSRYFLLLPVVVNKVAFGLLYADMQESKKLQITAKQPALLRTLRNQAVLAIRQQTLQSFFRIRGNGRFPDSIRF